MRRGRKESLVRQFVCSLLLFASFCTRHARPTARLIRKCRIRKIKRAGYESEASRGMIAGGSLRTYTGKNNCSKSFSFRMHRDWGSPRILAPSSDAHRLTFVLASWDLRKAGWDLHGCRQGIVTQSFLFDQRKIPLHHFTIGIQKPGIYTCPPQSVSKCNVSKMKYDFLACQGKGYIGENVLPTIISHTSAFLKSFTSLLIL